MIYLDAIYRLADTDLAAHLGCHHLTQLEARLARCKLKRPQYYDPTIDVLRKNGIEHERQYLDEHLQAQGFSVTSLPEHKATPVDTLAAMRQGADVISQVALAQHSVRRPC